MNNFDFDKELAAAREAVAQADAIEEEATADYFFAYRELSAAEAKRATAKAKVLWANAKLNDLLSFLGD